MFDHDEQTVSWLHTVPGDDKYDGFKASAPNVAPHCPSQPPKLSAAKADRAQFKPKLLVRLAKVSSCHVQQGQKSHSGGAELEEGLRLSLPELAREDTDGV